MIIFCLLGFTIAVNRNHFNHNLLGVCSNLLLFLYLLHCKQDTTNHEMPYSTEIKILQSFDKLQIFNVLNTNIIRLAYVKLQKLTKALTFHNECLWLLCLCTQVLMKNCTFRSGNVFPSSWFHWFPFSFQIPRNCRPEVCRESPSNADASNTVLLPVHCRIESKLQI